MKLNVILLGLVFALCGCSLSIIHPPSAAAFMEKGDGWWKARLDYIDPSVHRSLYINTQSPMVAKYAKHI